MGAFFVNTAIQHSTNISMRILTRAHVFVVNKNHIQNQEGAENSKQKKQGVFLRHKCYDHREGRQPHQDCDEGEGDAHQNRYQGAGLSLIEPVNPSHYQ